MHTCEKFKIFIHFLIGVFNVIPWNYKYYRICLQNKRIKTVTGSHRQDPRRLIEHFRIQIVREDPNPTRRNFKGRHLGVSLSPHRSRDRSLSARHCFTEQSFKRIRVISSSLTSNSRKALLLRIQQKLVFIFYQSKFLVYALKIAFPATFMSCLNLVK